MFNLAEKYWNWREHGCGYSKYKLFALIGLSGILRNDWADRKAGSVFIQAHKSGVKSFKKDHYNMNIEFNDGTEFNLWIANKMYAYGSGSYKQEGESTTKIQGLLPRWVNLVALEVENS